MQKVQNTAARLILRAPRHQNCTAPLAPNFWTNKIQNCLHVLQRNHRFRSLLSFWAATPLQGRTPALSALRQTHARSKSNDSTANPMAFELSLTLAPTSGTISPKTSGTLLLSHSLFLQKPTQDISFLRIFQLKHIVLLSYQSVQCVCVRACVRACVCIFSIWVLLYCLLCGCDSDDTEWTNRQDIFLCTFTWRE